MCAVVSAEQKCKVKHCLSTPCTLAGEKAEREKREKKKEKVVTKAQKAPVEGKAIAKKSKFKGVRIKRNRTIRGIKIK